MSSSGGKIVIVALFAGLVAAGCSTQAPRVHCDGQLEPINRPVPPVTAGPVLAGQNQAEPAKP